MNATTAAPDDEQIAALRAFNRCYARTVGALQEHLLGSPYTFAEARVLWELAHHDGIAAGALARELALDAGYLSRLVAGLKERKLVKAERGRDDARRSELRLTAAGRKAYGPLDRRSQASTAAVLERLPPADRARLVEAASTMRRLLEAPPAAPREPWLMRPFGPGDIGWIVSRHGALYAQEYGFDASFEALVARIGAQFLERHDARREACWIAERDGQPVGSVMLVQARDDDDAPEPGVAQLRLLLVEPAARGLAIGRRLVAECDRYARAAGYTRIRLWTQSLLVAARSLYERDGYRLVEQAPHESFGHALVGETWEKPLGSSRA